MTVEKEHRSHQKASTIYLSKSSLKELYVSIIGQRIAGVRLKAGTISMHHIQQTARVESFLKNLGSGPFFTGRLTWTSKFITSGANFTPH